MNTTSDVTMNSETFLDTNYSFSHPEVKDIKNILSENIENCNFLKNRIVFPTFNALSFNDEIECLNGDYGEKISKLGTIISERKHKGKENISGNCRKQIETLKKKIDKLQNEIKCIRNEEEKIKNRELSYETALKYYIGNFDFTVEVESQEKDQQYWMKVVFSGRSQFYCRFLMDLQKNFVIDFDAHTFLSPQQEEVLKEYYKQTNNICTIMKLLRNIVVNINS